MMVAHCQLRNDQRTFKLDRIARLIRIELGAGGDSQNAGGAKIYDAPDGGAAVYEAPEAIRLASMSVDVDLAVPEEVAAPQECCDLTIPSNPS